MSASAALPFRIFIYEKGGKTNPAVLKPVSLLAMVDSRQLEGVAQEVERAIVKIMRDSALADMSIAIGVGSNGLFIELGWIQILESI